MDRQMHFEIIVRQLEDGEILGESLIKEIEVKKPKNIMDVGFRHSEQISIIDEIQNKYIPLQCKLLLSQVLTKKIKNLLYSFKVKFKFKKTNG